MPIGKELSRPFRLLTPFALVVAVGHLKARILLAFLLDDRRPRDPGAAREAPGVSVPHVLGAGIAAAAVYTVVVGSRVTGK